MDFSVILEVKGTRYYKASELWQSGALTVGLPVRLVHQADNPHDPNALAIKLMATGAMLGHISRKSARKYSTLVDNGKIKEAYTHSVSNRLQSAAVRVRIRVVYEKDESLGWGQNREFHSLLWVTAATISAGPGIYTLRNIETGRQYVGSSISVRKRIRSHIHDLYYGVHANEALQSDFFEYGDSSFEAKLLIAEPDTSRLAILEERAIRDLLVSRSPLYNLTNDGQGRPKGTREYADSLPISERFDRALNDIVSKDKFSLHHQMQPDGENRKVVHNARALLHSDVREKAERSASGDSGALSALQGYASKWDLIKAVKCGDLTAAQLRNVASDAPFLGLEAEEVASIKQACRETQEIKSEQVSPDGVSLASVIQGRKGKQSVLDAVVRGEYSVEQLQLMKESSKKLGLSRGDLRVLENVLLQTMIQNAKLAADKAIEKRNRAAKVQQEPRKDQPTKYDIKIEEYMDEQKDPFFGFESKNDLIKAVYDKFFPLETLEEIFAQAEQMGFLPSETELIEHAILRFDQAQRTGLNQEVFKPGKRHNFDMGNSTKNLSKNERTRIDQQKHETNRQHEQVQLDERKLRWDRQQEFLKREAQQIEAERQAQIQLVKEQALQRQSEGERETDRERKARFKRNKSSNEGKRPQCLPFGAASLKELKENALSCEYSRSQLIKLLEVGSDIGLSWEDLEAIREVKILGRKA